jgi:catechol 2,3-dioxygenase-like lactoylglutathione lyase family enzyme
MIIKESNVTIMIADMDTSVNFYQQLGFTLKNRWENHYAQISTGDMIIGLHPADRRVIATPQVSIGFVIDDIKEAKQLLEKNDISYEFYDDEAGSYTNFNDPDGTQLYFTQPKWR